MVGIKAFEAVVKSACGSTTLATAILRCYIANQLQIFASNHMSNQVGRQVDR